MTSHLEVRARTDAEWSKAILVGFNIWRQVRKENGGRVTVDLEKRDLFYASSPARKKGLAPPISRVKKTKTKPASTLAEAKRTNFRPGRAANG